MAIGDISIFQPAAAGALPGTAFAGVAMGSTVRADDAVTITKANDSTVQINNASGRRFLMRAAVKIEDLSNGRATTQLQFANTSGATTVFFTTGETGYSRDTSENEHNVIAWCVVEPNATNVQVQLQWRRDTDAPTGGLVVANSSWEVIEIDWEAVGHYAAATTGQAYGGVALNTVVLDSTIVETGGGVISRSGNTITVSNPDSTYLVIGTMWGNNGNQRTQRNIRLAYGGASAPPDVEANCYQRNASNEYAGVQIADIIRRPAAGSNITINMEAYRGAGVANDQGGADVDGNWDNQFAHLIVLQLPLSIEAIRYHDSVGLQAQAGTTSFLYNISDTEDFTDAASWSTNSGGFTAEYDGDALVCANIWSARSTVTSGARLTVLGRWDIDGTDQPRTEHSFYNRGNQGSQDTFGSSLHPSGVLAVSTFDFLRVNSARIAGGESGNARTQPNSVSAWALNIATFASAGPPDQTVTAGAGSVNATGAAATVIPGAVSAPAGAGVVNANGAGSAVLPGAVSASAGAGTVSVNGVAAGAAVPLPQVVPAGTGLVNVNGVAATPVPGAVSSAAGAGVVNPTGIGAIAVPGAVAALAGAGLVQVNGLAGAGVPGPVSAAAGAGLVQANGVDAAVDTSARIDAGTGQVNINGVAAAVVAGPVLVAAGTGSVQANGIDAAADAPAAATAGTGQVLAQGEAASVELPAPAGTAQVLATGVAAAVVAGPVTADAGTGSVNPTGVDAAVSVGPTVVAGTGSVQPTGVDATAIAPNPIASAGTGLVQALGEAAAVVPGGVAVVAPPGSVQPSGVDAGVLPGPVSTSAGTGLVQATGQAATADAPIGAGAGTGLVQVFGVAADVEQAILAGVGVVQARGVPAGVLPGPVVILAGVGVVNANGQLASAQPGAVAVLAETPSVLVNGINASFKAFDTTGATKLLLRAKDTVVTVEAPDPVALTLRPKEATIDLGSPGPVILTLRPEGKKP